MYLHLFVIQKNLSITKENRRKVTKEFVLKAWFYGNSTDDFPRFFLKVHFLERCVVIMYKWSLELQRLASQWKTVTISAIYKHERVKTNIFQRLRLSRPSSRTISDRGSVAYASLHPIALHGSSRRGESACSINIMLSMYIHTYTRHGAIACAQNSARNKRAILGPYRTIIFRSVWRQTIFFIKYIWKNFNANWFCDIYS